MTLTEFLLARIIEDEAEANAAIDAEVDLLRRDGLPDLTRDELLTMESGAWRRPLIECKAKRRIVEFHKAWPVLVQQEDKFEPASGTDPSEFAFRVSRRMAWLTEQEYRTRFGDEPPTAPMLAAMAEVYADHPDYREEWRP